MKKNFLTALALFAAVALTACGGTKKCEDGKHKFEKWEVTTPATCKAVGEQQRTCTVCGYKETKEIAKKDHTWNEGVITTPATCSTPGVKTYTCTVCNETKTEEVKADHVWDAGTPVTKDAGKVDYTIFTCTLCNKAKKIEFAAKPDTTKYTISGGLKADSSYPDYMKLNANGDYIEYTLDCNIAGNAKIYQRGVMDYWHDDNNNNHTRNYYSGKNNQDGNFELLVNGTAVDYSWSSSLTYEDMLPGEYTGTYSPLGDALIGECTLNGTSNVIRYTRKESYNMLIKDFVIIVENPLV